MSKPIDLHYLRKAATCIHIAAEKTVADDISRCLIGAADELAALRAQVDTAYAEGYAGGKAEMADLVRVANTMTDSWCKAAQELQDKLAQATVAKSAALKIA